MSEPTEVVIVRPAYNLVSFVVDMGVTVFYGWVAMLILPYVVGPGFAPGFWRCLFGVWGVQALTGGTSWMNWTKLRA